MDSTTPTERRWRNVADLAESVRRHWPDAVPTFVRRDGAAWPESVEYRMPDGRLVASARRWSLIASKRLRVGWVGRIGEGIESEIETEGDELEVDDMATKYPDLFAALANPFEPGEVKQRNQANRTFHYVTARTVMNRLDAVLGPENWWDEYIPNQHSVLCKLTIVLPEGEVLTKADAGGYAGMQDQGDDDKSGYSDAFKRAAVKFGIGRYLYMDGVPDFVKGTIDNIPKPGPNPGPGSSGQRQSQDRQHDDRPPRNGRQLFAWCKAQEDRIGRPGLVKYLNEWAKGERLPPKMIDWNEEDVVRAHAIALQAIANVTGDTDPDDDYIDRQAARDAG